MSNGMYPTGFKLILNQGGSLKLIIGEFRIHMYLAPDRLYSCLVRLGTF
jgi:hypothetical protein